jgi:serine/threonine protein kinase
MSDNGEAALSNGTMIKDRYRVERLLGAGGMGAVYAARDTILDKRVALKILHKEIADDENMTARFIQEPRARSSTGTSSRAWTSARTRRRPSW